MATKSSRKKAICYLCGRNIEGKISWDHVPPRQFYSTEIRKVNEIEMTTLPSHTSCNQAYQKDEEYCVAALLPAIMDGPEARSRLKDIFEAYYADKNTGLVKKVHTEWDRNPKEIQLGPGQVAKRFDGKRVRRVMWKIVRGLYFSDHRILLPETISCHIDHRWPGSRLPEQYLHLDQEPLQGDYPNVFSYRYRYFPEVKGLSYWSLHLWSRITFFVAHHDAACGCAKCSRNSKLRSY